MVVHSFVTDKTILNNQHVIRKLYYFSDALYCLIFALGILLWGKYSSKVAELNDYEQITPKDFTIKITGLPRNPFLSNKDCLIDHFNNLKTNIEEKKYKWI
jgi:hypothetical protein